MGDLPTRVGSLTLIEIRQLQTPRQKKTYAMARCDCGVMTKVPLDRWKRQAWRMCGGCSTANWIVAGKSKWIEKGR